MTIMNTERHLKYITFFMALLPWMILPGLTQSRNPEPASAKADQKQERLVIEVELVNVPFSVLDKKNRLVTDLEQGDFKIFENDKLQTITNFSRETDLPLTIGMLIDTSTSIRDKLRFEQDAAIDFFHTTLRRKKDKGALVSFDSNIDILQDFTDDPDVLTKAVKRLKPGGGTRMFDAIVLVCQEKMRNENSTRKVLLVISDGDDNLSRGNLESTLEIAQRAEVSIFAISTNSSGFFGMESPKHDRILKKMAEETGGRTFFPSKAEDLAQSFFDVSQELRSQYSLAYRSANPSRDGAFRSIRIESSRKDVKVKSRKGYYAPKG